LGGSGQATQAQDKSDADAADLHSFLMIAGMAYRCA